MFVRGAIGIGTRGIKSEETGASRGKKPSWAMGQMTLADPTRALQ